MTTTDGPRGVPSTLPEQPHRLASRDDIARLILPYKFGMQEITTKVEILREEFELLHDYNPIDHVSSRLKSLESVVDKVSRKGGVATAEWIRASVTDIAGVRVVCSFASDVRLVHEALTSQEDVRVLQTKDYIASPKFNGYRSLHTIVGIPVFMSSETVEVPVEVQFRTVAMDFWASLEHKIFYKYRGDVPDGLQAQLRDAAATAAHMDDEMERLHDSVHGDRHAPDAGAGILGDVPRGLV
ncbi:GTP pyrophosphokinase family protein [Demequina sp. NBRC 110052]|uniref:GTP pyrophosphokinase n=1 Tax=Demequina sp. NBRC 110052 TaxID=1570341 RepID=UPI000A05D89B|nr:GTP pyrophosphokinase family protein [Demequina sp. NBRC 110052]